MNRTARFGLDISRWLVNEYPTDMMKGTSRKVTSSTSAGRDIRMPVTFLSNRFFMQSLPAFRRCRPGGILGGSVPVARAGGEADRQPPAAAEPGQG